MNAHRNGSAASLPCIRQIASVMLLVCAASALTACSTPQKFSYLDGYRWSRAEINTYDTYIVSVDGKSYTYNSKIMVDPGRHHIVFQTQAADGLKFSPQVALDIDIKPCTRYWFEAKRTNSLDNNFEPRVNWTIPIQGCGVEPSTAMGSGNMGY